MDDLINLKISFSYFFFLFCQNTKKKMATDCYSMQLVRNLIEQTDRYSFQFFARSAVHTAE